MPNTSIRLPVAPPSQVHPKGAGLGADEDISEWLDAMDETAQIEAEPDLDEYGDGPWLAALSTIDAADLYWWRRQQEGARR